MQAVKHNTRMDELFNHLVSPVRRARILTGGFAIFAILMFVGILRAQSTAFEVASVKPSEPGARGMIMQFTPNGGVRFVNARLRDLIALAYGVERFQVRGGPAWLDTQGWVIVGKGESGAEKESRDRLRALLTERFQLGIREDRKEASVLLLRIAKNGSKLRQSSEGFEGISGRPGQVAAERVGTSMLARYLSTQLGRPVVDETGLAGTYAFKLEWAPDSIDPLAKEKGGTELLVNPNGESITSAIQSQLGLKLESGKAAISDYIVERVEKPSEN